MLPLPNFCAANVGADKDGDKRQLAAIHVFAQATGFEVVYVYDAAVSGADPRNRASAGNLLLCLTVSVILTRSSNPHRPKIA
jgi:hypothetical protein